MVRLYLLKRNEKGKKQYIDVSIWSLFKSYILSWLIFMAIVWGTIIVIVLIWAILYALIRTAA